MIDFNGSIKHFEIQFLNSIFKFTFSLANLFSHYIVTMDCYRKIAYNGKEYAVCKITYKDHTIPITLDWTDFDRIKQLNKRWRCTPNGFVTCSHTVDGDTKDVYLHELIMLLNNKDQEINEGNRSIIHINRIGLDNRRENLMYDILEKDYNKNLKKKKRTIELPHTSQIDPDEIPTYIWYMKPDISHGDRFVVNIGDVMWKTTSSNDMSLRYKLEEAKLFVRHLLRARPDLMEEYSMNGDYNKGGKELSNSYYDIVHQSGFNNIERFIPDNNTISLLQPNYDGMDKKRIIYT